MIDMCNLGKSVGVNIYNSTSTDNRSISKAIEFIVPYLGKSQKDFPYQQIKEWDLNQQKLCWLIRRASMFKKDKAYDKLFDQYINTKPSDIKWLLYAK